MFQIWYCEMIPTTAIRRKRVRVRERNAPGYPAYFIRTFAYVCVCAATIFQNSFHIPRDGTHIPHISAGIHAAKKIQ